LLLHEASEAATPVPSLHWQIYPILLYYCYSWNRNRTCACIVCL